MKRLLNTSPHPITTLLYTLGLPCENLRTFCKHHDRPIISIVHCGLGLQQVSNVDEPTGGNVKLKKADKN